MFNISALYVFICELSKDTDKSVRSDIAEFVNKLIYGCEEFNITGSC